MITKMGGGNDIPKKDRIQPVPNSTASYWRSEPHWLDEYRSTKELPSQADIVIVGTGLAGVSTAYHLLDRKDNDYAHQPSILLLEARQVCSGATGRNGGHIKKLPSTIINLIDKLGSTDAGEVVKFIRSNVYGVKRVIEKEKIEAQAELRRSFDVSLQNEDAKEVKREFEKECQSGFPLSEDVGFVGEDFAEHVSCGLSVDRRDRCNTKFFSDHVNPRRSGSSQHNCTVVLAIQIRDATPREGVE